MSVSPLFQRSLISFKLIYGWRLPELLAHNFPTDSFCPTRQAARHQETEESVNSVSTLPMPCFKTFLFSAASKKKSKHPSPLFSSYPLPCLKHSKTVDKSMEQDLGPTHEGMHFFPSLQHPIAGEVAGYRTPRIGGLGFYCQVVETQPGRNGEGSTNRIK